MKQKQRDKKSESFIIEKPNFSKRFTKRNILQTLASIYETLGFIFPCLLTEKSDLPKSL